MSLSCAVRRGSTTSARRPLETSARRIVRTSPVMLPDGAVRFVATCPVQDEATSALPDTYNYRTITTVHSSLSAGCIDYARGWAWQQYLLSRRLAFRRNQQGNRDSDTVLLFQHYPVYTLGRGADEKYLTFLETGERHHEKMRQRLSRFNRGADSARLSIDRRLLQDILLSRSDQEAVDIFSRQASPVLAPNGAPIFRVERGGEVTFHGPGQLVVYPLLDLQRDPYKQDLHWFLRMVEEVIIQTLQHYDIVGCRDEINTGVFVGHEKIAAVGVSSSRWITTHGFALNVCPDLSYFDTSVIMPCGIDGRGVTSIAEILAGRQESKSIPSVEDVSNIVLRCLQDVFGIEIDHGESLR